MAVPVIPFALMGAAAYAVWRAFGPGKRQEPGAHNNWRNEDFASREAARRKADEAPAAKPAPRARRKSAKIDGKNGEG